MTSDTMAMTQPFDEHTQPLNDSERARLVEIKELNGAVLVRQAAAVAAALDDEWLLPRQTIQPTPQHQTERELRRIRDVLNAFGDLADREGGTFTFEEVCVECAWRVSAVLALLAASDWSRKEQWNAADKYRIGLASYVLLRAKQGVIDNRSQSELSLEGLPPASCGCEVGFQRDISASLRDGYAQPFSTEGSDGTFEPRLRVKEMTSWLADITCDHFVDEFVENAPFDRWWEHSRFAVAYYAAEVADDLDEDGYEWCEPYVYDNLRQLSHAL